jgi:hypothetical protein
LLDGTGGKLSLITLTAEAYWGIKLAPCILRLYDIITNSFIETQEPCFVQQKDFKSGESRSICNFVAEKIENVEEQELLYAARVAPALKAPGP